MSEPNGEELIELADRRMTVSELRARVSTVDGNIHVLSECEGQTLAGARVTFARLSELIQPEALFAVVVDLGEVTSRPPTDYREYMEDWARTLPPFHAAYVLPPVGALTRMALRFIALRVMKVHDKSTSSYHDSLEEAVEYCRGLLARAQQA